MVNKWRESSTFKLVVISWVIVTWAFIDSRYGDSHIAILDYAQATSLLFGIWLGREWRAAHYKGE